MHAPRLQKGSPLLRYSGARAFRSLRSISRGPKAELKEWLQGFFSALADSRMNDASEDGGTGRLALAQLNPLMDSAERFSHYFWLVLLTAMFAAHPLGCHRSRRPGGLTPKLSPAPTGGAVGGEGGWELERPSKGPGQVGVRLERRVRPTDWAVLEACGAFRFAWDRPRGPCCSREECAARP